MPKTPKTLFQLTLAYFQNDFIVAALLAVSLLSILLGSSVRESICVIGIVLFFAGIRIGICWTGERMFSEEEEQGEGERPRC